MRSKKIIGLKTKSLLILCGLSLGGVSCSLTATRPIQEMSNAEVALKAARDLNADSLVPDIFRAANEEFYKAKRDFRLKDFENSKKHALRAMRLAEQAEFEAYRMGGATPEAASRGAAPEGSFPDADAAFREGTAPPEESFESPTSGSGGAQKEPEEKGIDYNEYVRQKEAEAQREAAEQEKAKEKKDEKKPSGPTGPALLVAQAKTKPASGVPVPTLGVPQTGSLGPNTGKAPGADFQPQNLNQDLRPEPGSPKPQIYYEGADPVPPSVENIKAQPIPEAGLGEIGMLGATPPEEKQGFESMNAEDLPSMNAEEVPTIGATATPNPSPDRVEDKQQ